MKSIHFRIAAYFVVMNGCRFHAVAVFLYQAFCPNMAPKCHCWVETSRLQKITKTPPSSSHLHPGKRLHLPTFHQLCWGVKSQWYVSQTPLSPSTTATFLPSFQPKISAMCFTILSPIQAPYFQSSSRCWWDPVSIMTSLRPLQVEGHGSTVGVPKFITTPTGS